MHPMDPTEAEESRQGDARRYVMVAFTVTGKLFPALVKGALSPPPGATLLVSTERGPELGKVVVGAKPMEIPGNVDTLEVLRVATADDLTQEDRNREREQLASKTCLRLIAKHAIPMKLVQVHYLMGGQKAIFYFTAEGRVDFRLLVKDLAQKLRIRIEMRQIGVRDETKMIGGVGHCGLSLCCSTWLRDFVPVSIRMAKDQNLALNPQKVSGACGRLLCCLAYEHETYVDAKKDLPKVGRHINTTAGPGKVMSLEVLKERFVIELDSGERILMAPSEILPGSGPVFSRPRPTTEGASPEPESLIPEPPSGEVPEPQAPKPEPDEGDPAP